MDQVGEDGNEGWLHIYMVLGCFWREGFGVCIARADVK